MSEQREAVPLMVLVCGGRDFSDRTFAFRTLDAVAVHAAEFSTVGVHVVQGGAEGADALAREWAQARSVPMTTYPANWQRDGKAAGPLRNQRMLAATTALPYPMLVLAFPGGRGTADMVRRATAANCEVLHRSPTPSAVTPPTAIPHHEEQS